MKFFNILFLFILQILCFCHANSDVKLNEKFANITNLDKSYLEISREVCNVDKKIQREVCEIYADVLQKLIERNNTISTQNVEKVLQQLTPTLKAEEFCEQANQTLSLSGEFVPRYSTLIKKSVCLRICIDVSDDESLTIKPICKFILLGLRELAKAPVPVVASVPIQPHRSNVVVIPKIQGEENHNKKEESMSEDKPKGNIHDPVVQYVANPSKITETVPALPARESYNVKTITLNESNPEASNKLDQATIKNKETKAMTSNQTVKPEPQTIEIPNVQESDKKPEQPEVKINNASLPPVANDKAPVSPPNEKEKPVAEEKSVAKPMETVSEKIQENVVTPDSKSDTFIPQDNFPKNQYPDNSEGEEDLDPGLNGIGDDYDEDKMNDQKSPSSPREQQPIKEIEDVDSDGPQKQEIVRDIFVDETDNSSFFTYFTAMGLLVIVGYILYHNRSKLVAIILEGRRHAGSRGGRRKHSAVYKKLALDCNLEEAITSKNGISSSKTTDVIY